MFSGPRGTGKTSSARLLAHAVNSLEYDVENPHIDIIEIDAASNRRIDEVRDIREKVQIAPTSAKFKVYIIDEVHMLTKEAFNALLKTLEEPPSHAIFILATTEPHKLPDTIISRTQHLRFTPIAAGDITSHLQNISGKEGLTIDDRTLELIAQRSEGGMRDAVSLLDLLSSDAKEITYESAASRLGATDDQQVEDVARAIDQGSAGQVLSALGAVKSSGSDPLVFTDQLIDHLLERGTPGDLDLIDRLMSVRSGSRHWTLLKIALLRGLPASEAVIKPSASAGRPVPPKSNPGAKAQDPDEEPKPTKQNTPAKADTAPAAKTPKDSSNKNLKPEVQGKTQAPKKPTIESPKPQDIQPKASKKLEDVKPEDLANIHEYWDEILSVAKDSSTGSLYATLRMSKPQAVDGMLNLIFKFPFHRKQAESPKALAAIKDIINQSMGGNVNIKMIDQEQAREGGAGAKGDVDSVLDIMGGGEEVQI